MTNVRVTYILLPAMMLTDTSSQSSFARFHQAICCLLICAATLVLSACGGGGGSSTPITPTTPAETQVATPAISTKAAQNGAQVVSMSTSTSGATIYYTLDGSAPSASSQQYFAPLLLASNGTVNAIGVLSGDTNSAVATQAVTTGTISSATLIWGDEFNDSGNTNIQPDANTWTYDTGAGGWGNNELETYCAWGSSASPCSTSSPNAYVGTCSGSTDGSCLHIVAQNPSPGVYTSARMKTQGLFSVGYGRVEARIQLQEGKGLWPAFWLLGSNITVNPWPACGEQDVMEHINAPSPDWVQASVHGTNLSGGTPYSPSGFDASQWHTYGMIWSNGTVKYYVDDPANPYETFTSSMAGTWPFDSGAGNFIILNLAVGGNWPGAPDGTTAFPSEMLVDYVRVYTN